MSVTESIRDWLRFCNSQRYEGPSEGTLTEWADHVEKLERDNAALLAVAKELNGALRQYELDADESPPRSHREMMERADQAIGNAE
jgi:hypothetical protein